MSSFIWKPSTVNSWKGGPVLLAPDSGTKQAPTITGSDGKTYTGKYVNTNEQRHQWVFPKELVGMQGLQVSYGGQTGTIQSGSQSYEGGDIGGWQARDKGSLGGSGGEAGVGGWFTPGQAGQFGFYPAYLGGEFPSPSLANYKDIKKSPYKATDVFDFASKFGELNRSEIGKNYEQSKNMGLDALNTELKGLQGFAPAAAALQRSLVSEDNIFNQQQRTQQIDQTLPGVRGQLNDQGTRAETFAGGRLGSAIEDRAYEVSARSRAADLASSGGFGAGSSAARKTSDLMSAEQRLNLSKYGDQLLGQNISTKANLLLAPTEYANAGSQIKVNPTVDAATRGSQFLNEINQGTLLSPGAALQGTIQQEQFKTSLDSQTRQFNAGNRLQTSMFNAGVENQFALAQFGYNVGYAGAVAGAYQTDSNTQLELQQQQQAQDTFNASKNDTQTSNTIGAITGILSGIGSFLGGGSSGGADTGGGDVSGFDVEGGGMAEPPPLAPPAEDYNGSGTSAPSSSGTVTGSTYDPTVSVPSSGGGSSPSYSSTPLPSSGPYSSPETVSLGSSDSVPQTFDFARMASIAPDHAVQMKSFIQDVGTGGAPRISLPAARTLAAASDNTMQMAGLSNKPQAGYVPAGYNTSGKQIYASKALMTNSSTEPGSEIVNTIAKTFSPFQSFTKEDQTHLEKIGGLVDSEFLKTLDNFAAAKDPKAFAKLLDKAVKHVTERDTKVKKKDSKSKQKTIKRKAA